MVVRQTQASFIYRVLHRPWDDKGNPISWIWLINGSVKFSGQRHRYKLLHHSGTGLVGFNGDGKKRSLKTNTIHVEWGFWQRRKSDHIRKWKIKKPFPGHETNIVTNPLRESARVVLAEYLRTSYKCHVYQRPELIYRQWARGDIYATDQANLTG